MGPWLRTVVTRATAAFAFGALSPTGCVVHSSSTQGSTRFDAATNTARINGKGPCQSHAEVTERAHAMLRDLCGGRRYAIISANDRDFMCIDGRFHTDVVARCQ